MLGCPSSGTGRASFAVVWVASLEVIKINIQYSLHLSFTNLYRILTKTRIAFLRIKMLYNESEYFCFLQIILQAKQRMNILSFDEMQQVQDLLLNIAPKPAYILKTPEEREYQNTNHFLGSIFPLAGPSTQKTIQQMVTLTDNVCSLKLTNPNSVYQMLAYNLTSILYRDKYKHNNDNQSEGTHYLLDTLKCSLYSPDVEFTCLKNIDFAVDTLQMKAMAARFLAFMEDRTLRLTVNRFKCALWIFDHNPMLLATFVLLFRFILFRLEIEGTNNYINLGNPDESIVNLIEYFDLSYRSLGNLFLFYDDGIFLALTEREVVAGDYFENQSDKRNEKQQLQMKSSVKMNMIESFLVNVDEKSSLIAPKKIGMVQSDLKMMNFILDSSSQDAEFISKGKDSDIETPTFNDNPDLFHFGKKKKDSSKAIEDIKSEFQRLIMDKSDCSEEYNEQVEDEASTPFLGGSNNYSLAARFQPTTSHKVDSPIDELDRVHNIPSEKSRIEGNLLIIKKSEVGIDQKQPVFTPSTSANKSMGFSLGANQQNFLNFAPENKPNDLQKILNCQCRGLRVQRNTLNSNVIVVAYIPTESDDKFNFQVKSATKLSKYNIERQREPIKQPKDHKPSFLKNLKKHKEGREEINFAKSSVTETLKRDSSFVKDHNQQYKTNSFKKSSDIIHPNYPKKYANIQHKNVQKQVDHKSCKSLNIAQDSKIDNEPKKHNKFIQQRQADSFQQRSYDYYDSKRMKSGDLSSRFSTNYKTSQPYKFYAPVQIIAPTVYFGSSNHNSNNMVFKVGDYGSASDNPQAKKTHHESKRIPTDHHNDYSNIHKTLNYYRGHNF